MPEAVIVATARTPIGRARKGSLVDCRPDDLAVTAVRAALAEGRMDTALAYLGRYYSISGRVVHGDGVGRKLGFPTANIQLQRNRPPLQGIYAAQVHADLPWKQNLSTVPERTQLRVMDD